MDAFVQSTDKNFLVPVGGCVVKNLSLPSVKSTQACSNSVITCTVLLCCVFKHM